MWREVARFELQLQRREFLTGVYVAVFFFLTFGYTASSAVELVAGRGALPRNAPWALAQAMAGVTAFGQVITTMITATAVMRDVATRQQELLFATPLSRGDYLWGRWLGALAVMLIVYLAIPIGLVTGTLMPWIDRASLLPFAASAYVRPFAILVLPNVLVVSAIFFSAGALRRGFMAILLLGVGLVALWGTGVSLARDGVAWGTLVDPFGNAALEWSTREWSVAERTTRAVAADGWLLANRALWLTVATGAMLWLQRAFRFEVVAPPDARRERGRERRAARRALAPAAATMAVPRDASGGSRIGGTPAVRAEARWIFRWTLREKGFVTLGLLGAANALVNAWRAGGANGTAGDVLGAVQFHSRVFLTLVATIYAGELVWRERDVRVDALRDALPPSTGALVAGKIVGLLLAELVLVTPLLVAALIAGYGRGAAGMSVGLAMVWIGGLVYPVLVQLTLLSLLVHAVVQHKVAGHVLLITGWVSAIALDRSVPVPALLRYTTMPPYTWNPTHGFGGVGPAITAWTLWWTTIAVACAILAAARWRRGLSSSPLLVY